MRSPISCKSEGTGSSLGEALAGSQQTTNPIPKQPKPKACRKRLNPDGCPGRQEEEERTQRDLRPQERRPPHGGDTSSSLQDRGGRRNPNPPGTKLSPDGKSGNWLNPHHPRRAQQSPQRLHHHQEAAPCPYTLRAALKSAGFLEIAFAPTDSTR